MQKHIKSSAYLSFVTKMLSSLNLFSYLYIDNDSDFRFHYTIPSDR